MLGVWDNGCLFSGYGDCVFFFFFFFFFGGGGGGMEKGSGLVGLVKVGVRV